MTVEYIFNKVFETTYIFCCYWCTYLYTRRTHTSQCQQHTRICTTLMFCISDIWQYHKWLNAFSSVVFCLFSHDWINLNFLYKECNLCSLFTIIKHILWTCRDSTKNMHHRVNRIKDGLWKQRVFDIMIAWSFMHQQSEK